MPPEERRKQKRVPAHLLTCYRVKAGKETATGFVRTLNLSQVGAMLESPDRFENGQALSLEFLMDNDEVLKLRGIVSHSSPGEQGMNQIGVVFENLTPRARDLLARQIEAE